MSGDLMPAYQFGAAVSPQRIDEDELMQNTLVQGNEIVIWEEQVPADKAFVWGSGPDSRQAGSANYSYAEFLANGSGTGTDGNVIRDAEVFLAITDSTGEDTLAKTALTPDAGDLADAKADDRTERPVIPEHKPYASEDRVIQIRLKAGSDADGKIVGKDSDVHLGYGRVG